jgi:hypothetical protein
MASVCKRRSRQGGLNLGVVGGLGDLNHVDSREMVKLGGLARIGLEIGHLFDDVGGRETGETGVLGAALTIGKMTVAAGEDCGLAASGNDRRHRRMAVGMPVRLALPLFLGGVALLPLAVAQSLDQNTSYWAYALDPPATASASPDKNPPPDPAPPHRILHPRANPGLLPSRG